MAGVEQGVAEACVLKHRATPPLLGRGLPRAGIGAHIHPPAAYAMFCSINYSWTPLPLRELVLHENDRRASWVYENPCEGQLLCTATREKGKRKYSSTFGGSKQMASGSLSWCCVKSEGESETKNTTASPQKSCPSTPPRLLVPAGWSPIPDTQMLPPRAAGLPVGPWTPKPLPRPVAAWPSSPMPLLTTPKTRPSQTPEVSVHDSMHVDCSEFYFHCLISQRGKWRSPWILTTVHLESNSPKSL